MARLFVLGALILLATTACKKVERPPQDTVPTANPAIATVTEEQASPPRKRIPIPDDHIKLPKGHSSAGWVAGKYVELLCDPKAHRLSLNINPPEFRPDSGFPERTLIKVETLLTVIPTTVIPTRNGYPLTQTAPKGEICGWHFVELYPSHVPGNGTDGAYPAYALITLSYRGNLTWSGNFTDNWVATSFGTMSKDAEGCPAGYAGRVDVTRNDTVRRISADVFVQPPESDLMSDGGHFPTETGDFLHCNERLEIDIESY